METVRAFQSYDFVVSALMCDGAASNLLLIKTTLGVKGAIHSTDASNELNGINVSFENPFLPGRLIHWMICPSHQLKNLISALFSLYPERAKNFKNNDVIFGWEKIF